MTPKEKKEKAEILYRKIEDSMYLAQYTSDAAKQCALIAIDEKIKLYDELNEYGLLLPNSIGFELHEIKTEIEKL